MPKRSRRPSQHRAMWRGLLWRVALMAMVLIAGYLVYLDLTIRHQFEGKRWALPAQVYARPLEIFVGQPLRPAQFERELQLLDYRTLDARRRPGSYARHGASYDVVTRSFDFWDGKETLRALRIGFEQGRVATLQSLDDGPAPQLLRLDPALIGRIYPAHHEDRVLVQAGQLPLLLRTGLMAVEDQNFQSHFGIDLRAILRAFVTNVRVGEVVQGGSTLTQQLVKNFFLSNERTLGRKVNEALMALLLELHYDKDEILQAYSNEIYLGQDGRRAIHGFGLASEFYFEEPLQELSVPHLALLIGVVKGPSYYDPRRHPERALARRNVVVDVMLREGLITSAQAEAARRAPLGVTPKPRSGVSVHPAFLDLVRRQLRRDYREEDLTSEGLRIFTTLDPLVQRAAEEALNRRLTELERAGDVAELEGAVIVSSVLGAEVQAVVGGREAHFAGYNRALDAERQIGSLIKPAVYLTALQHPDRYTLLTQIDDSAISVQDRHRGPWQPANYDKQFHGRVPLMSALAHSYNAATVRLGMELGVDQVLDTVRDLGIERAIAPYPSMLLGAMSLTPLEVTSMYHTLAGGGFYTPLSAIREVVGPAGEPLRRYALNVQQAVAPQAAYLTTAALQEVVRAGTGESLQRRLSPALRIAGKTGTTDDLRDSWFAGYSGDRVAVVWVGRDDNQVAGLTGAAGAMQVWADVFVGLDSLPLDPLPPPGVERVWVQPASGLRAGPRCEGALELPFMEGSAPQQLAPCAEADNGPLRRSFDWFKGVFQ